MAHKTGGVVYVNVDKNMVPGRELGMKGKGTFSGWFLYHEVDGSEVSTSR